jgi:hypothetical protein
LDQKAFVLNRQHPVGGGCFERIRCIVILRC